MYLMVYAYGYGHQAERTSADKDGGKIVSQVEAPDFPGLEKPCATSRTSLVSTPISLNSNHLASNRVVRCSNTFH